MTTTQEMIIDRALNQVEDVASSAINRAQNIVASACVASRKAMMNDGADAVKVLEDVIDNIDFLKSFLDQKRENLVELVRMLKTVESEEN